MHRPQMQTLLLFITIAPSLRSLAKSQKSLKKLKNNVTEKL